VTLTSDELTALFRNDAFPRSGAYDASWVLENQMGPNVLWLTEWLTDHMTLQPGMRVLDMGCGKAMSSVFLAREFGVRVWANDLWIAADDNWDRLRDAGVADLVCPIHAEAHALPYAAEFFDAIVSLDAYHYFGTDDLYTNYFQKYVRNGGQIGVVVPGLMRDFPGDTAPEHLTREQASGGVFWADDCWSIRTLDWWTTHWGHCGSIEVEWAATMPDGWRHWLQHERAIEASGGWIFPSDEEVLEADRGDYLGFVGLVARRQPAEPDPENDA
jgi:cyclopropane fatty-acyl-phospholipid synthase-like methyltransferase